MSVTSSFGKTLAALALCSIGIPAQGASLDITLVAHLSLLSPPSGVTVTSVGNPWIPESPYAQYEWDCCGMFTQMMADGLTFTPDSVLAEIYMEGHQEGSVLGHPWHLGGTASVNTTPRLVVENTNDYAVQIPLEWSVSFSGFVGSNPDHKAGNTGYSALVLLLRNGLPAPGVDALLDKSGACTTGCNFSFNTSPAGTLYLTVDPRSVTKFALEAKANAYVQEAPEPAASALMGLGLAALAGWRRMSQKCRG